MQLVFPDRGTGGSQGFCVRGADGNRWWLKPLSNPQGQRVPVNEYVVGRLGALIGAPCCDVALIDVPPAHATAGLSEGVASGSLEVAGATEIKGHLAHRLADDNRRRHAGAFALWDLCFGADPQWLVQAADQHRTWSHDHGHFFPSGPNWSDQSLRDHVNVAHQLGGEVSGLDPDHLETVARNIDDLTSDAIASVMSAVPCAWPVLDAELESLGWFVDGRRADVASRLRSLIGVAP